MIDPRDISYDKNPEFNQDLDDNYPKIIIGGNTYSPSWVLFNIDYENYLAALDEYNDNKTQEFILTVYDEFPTPIAYYFRQAEHGALTNNEQLQFLRSTWEAIIFILYAIVVSEARKKGIKLRPLGISEKDLFHFSLDKKINIIEKILSFDLNNGKKLWSNTEFAIEDIVKIKELNYKRNGFQHSAPLSEDQAARLYVELFPEVVETLKQLSAFSKVELLHFISNVGNILKLKCETFKGNSPNRTFKNIEVTRDVFASSLTEINSDCILVKIGQELFSLSPFIHWVPDDDGHLTNLCYLHQIDKEDNAKYKFEIVRKSKYHYINISEFEDYNREYLQLTQKET